MTFFRELSGSKGLSTLREEKNEKQLYINHKSITNLKNELSAVV